MEKTTLEKLTEILVEQLLIKASWINPESRFVEDMGFDSLDAAELAVAVEDKFGILISDDDEANATTVQLAVELIDRLLYEKGRR